MPTQNNSQFLIYQTENQKTEIQVSFKEETVWLTQALLAQLFQVTVPTINEHLKNHAFVDGNKRIAAACFLYFLDQNEILYKSKDMPILSNNALATLTLFIAASKPEDMRMVVRLVLSVLNRTG